MQTTGFRDGKQDFPLDNEPTGQATFTQTKRVYGPTLVVHGEIDVTVATEFDRALDSLAARSNGPAYIDLGAVTFMDSTGVHALQRARHAGRAIDVSMRLVNASEPSRHALEICGALSLLSA